MGRRAVSSPSTLRGPRIFEPRHLDEAPPVALGTAKVRCNEGLRVIPGDLDTHDPSAQAEDVHIVVSTPEVQRYSGWPGQRLCHWRNALMASRGIDGSPSLS